MIKQDASENIDNYGEEDLSNDEDNGYTEKKFNASTPSHNNTPSNANSTNNNNNNGANNNNNNRNNNNNSSNGYRRNRVFIDPISEVPVLEHYFSIETYPDHYLIEKICDILNKGEYRYKFPKLEPRNIQLWFKNHRAKLKRLKTVPSSSSSGGGGGGGGGNQPTVNNSAASATAGARLFAGNLKNAFEQHASSTAKGKFVHSANQDDDDDEEDDEDEEDLDNNFEDNPNDPDNYTYDDDYQDCETNDKS